MESRNHCAYNQTRECFLGLEVDAADLSFADLEELIRTLAFKSGQGLWINPFRGIPETGIALPLDLIYLDDDSRVIDVVESFPTFKVSPSSPKADSVLVLPAHSIYSSQTQPGDQLVICVAEEMERRLAHLYNSTAASDVVQTAVLLREQPLWSGGPGVLKLKERVQEEYPDAEQPIQMNIAQPGTREVKAPRSWLERWWSPDPRKAPREPATGLAAYYWTGGAPKAQTIKDISSSGLYVVTEERWYPGTLILMTLQQTDKGDKTIERSISVHTRAVRCGSDGVGLQFILNNDPTAGKGSQHLVDGVDRKELEKFFRQLSKEKR